MLLKVLFYIPTHLYNLFVLLSPNPVFQYAYRPATEEERKQSEYIQNQYRKSIYKMNKYIDGAEK